MCCRQLWFRRSVCRLDPARRARLPGASITGLLSKGGLEYLCLTCSKYLSKGKDPPCSPFKIPDFPPLPPELQDLTDLENHLISPRIPFMHIRPLPRGKQLKLIGGCVNVPTDTAQVQTILPRTWGTEDTVGLKLKRRLRFKGSYRDENVRPTKIMDALKYLCQKPRCGHL